MSKHKPYQPATEGALNRFEAAWCKRCIKATAYNRCNIAVMGFLGEIGEDDYPKELRIIDGKPACTAFDPVGGPEPLTQAELIAREKTAIAHDKQRGQGRMF